MGQAASQQREACGLNDSILLDALHGGLGLGNAHCGICAATITSVCRRSVYQVPAHLTESGLLVQCAQRRIKQPAAGEPAAFSRHLQLPIPFGVDLPACKQIRVRLALGRNTRPTWNDSPDRR